MLLVKGLRSVFPTVLYFPAYGNSSYNIVAFRDAVSETDLQLHLDRFGPEAMKEVRKLTSKDPDSFFPDLVRDTWAESQDIEKEIKKVRGRLHTDDYPILEYRWAHGVKYVSILDSPLVNQ